MDDLGVIDPLEMNARHAEVRVPALALDGDHVSHTSFAISTACARRS
jgi:hypothetical protein